MTQTDDKALRIGLVGIGIESNSFAPVSGSDEFRVLEGEEGNAVLGLPGLAGFCAAMEEAESWQPVPLLLAYAESGGPVESGFFDDCLRRLRKHLELAGPLDGIAIFAHGAGITVDSKDMDGDYFEVVREMAGSDCPIVATTDTHANVSQRMLEAVDFLTGYRTNPHLDLDERGAEAARALADLIAGRLKPTTAYLRLPLVTAQIAQLTDPGEPLGELMQLAESLIQPPVVSISLWSGFSFSDTPYNGFSILVTTHDDVAAARRIARELGDATWALRQRFVRSTTSVDEAVRRAVAASRDDSPRPLILADVADNPGGGGRGNTTTLLRACAEAGVKGMQAGIFFDPDLAHEAASHGVGATFLARFNRSEDNVFSQPLSVHAEVRAIRDEPFVGKLGMARGEPIDLGLSALLRIADGIDVVVISRRQQILSSEYFEHLGLDPSRARSLLLKSRGHFRAGFCHLEPADILEVDAPGLTTPNLETVPWQQLPRPVFPLDPDTTWTPPGAW